MYAFNPQTGRVEDENGNPAPEGVPLDQVAPSSGGPQPGMLAANARAGQDLSQPFTIDRGGNTPGMTGAPPLPTEQVPGVLQTTVPPVPAPMQKTMEQETRTREIPTRGERNALGQVQDDFTRGAATAREEAGLIRRNADVNAAGENVRAAQAETNKAALAQEQQQHNELIAQAQAQIAADRQRYENERQTLAKMDVKDMYEGHPGMLVAKAITLALGAFGAALAKTGNGAAEVIAANENNWYKLQMARIEKQKGAVDEAKSAMALSQQGLAGARQAKADAIGDLNLWAAARADALAAKVRAMSAANGTQLAVVEGEKLAQAQEQRRDQYLLQYQEGLRAKVTTESQRVAGTGVGGAAGKPTEAQARYAMLAQQMNGELDTIQKNPQLATNVLTKMQARGQLAEAGDVSASKGIMGAVGVGALRGANILPKSKYDGMTEQEQLVVNAWDNATEKYARVLTGAGMPAEEARRMALQDSPHAGDSPVVIAQKFQRMRAAASQMMSLAGSAATSVAPAMQGAGGGGGKSGDDQQAVQWARSHPTDPRAKRILQMLGM